MKLIMFQIYILFKKISSALEGKNIEYAFENLINEIRKKSRKRKRKK